MRMKINPLIRKTSVSQTEYMRRRQRRSLIVADAGGDWRCIACTPLGMYEYDRSVRCLTNHLLEPLIQRHRDRGWDGEVLQTSGSRWRQLNEWLNAGGASVEKKSVARELCRREPEPDGLVNNAQTAFATIAITGRSSRSLWVADRPVSAGKFRGYHLDSGSTANGTTLARPQVQNPIHNA